jgi:enoyl-CoA hydratase
VENPFAPELLIEQRGAVAIVTLNRPEAMNSANNALHQGVINVWRHLVDSGEVRAVVLTGAGRAFSAGGDMVHLKEVQDDRAMREHEVAGAAQLVREMVACPLPVVAAVNGAAVGLGCNLAVLSDIVLISDEAFIADPHVSIGLTAADGGAPTWPLFMSLLRAKEYLFTGDRIGPELAVQLGLANRVVPAADLMDEAVKLAQRFAAQPPQAIQSTKKALNMHLQKAMQGVLEYALAEEFKSFDEPEHVEFVRRFLERSAASAAQKEQS